MVFTLLKFVILYEIKYSRFTYYYVEKILSS